MTEAEQQLAALALAAGVGLCLGWFALRLSIPDVVVFLAAGLLANLAGWRPFLVTDALGQALVVLAASYILYQGGESVEVHVLRPVVLTVVLLATVGVVVSLLVTGLAATALLGVPLLTGLLLGAVLAATDPAVLIPLYRAISVTPRISQVAISESALNDATGAVCTSIVTGLLVTGTASVPGIAAAFVQLAGFGILVGFGVGVLNVLFVHEPRGLLREFSGVLVFPMVVLAYVLAQLLGGSGLMAAFVTGVVVSNHGALPVGLSELTRSRLREYSEPTSVLIRALLFMGLGANLDLRALATLLGPALLVVVVLVCVARPLTVLVGAVPDLRAHWSWRELVILSWTRETGVVPGALATLLVSRHVAGAGVVAAVTALAIIVTVLVQGTTTGFLASRLGLTSAPESR